MTCDRIQFEVSQALDEDRDLSAFEDHLSICSECGDFATASVEIAERYRGQVSQGIGRLRRGTPAVGIQQTRASWLIPMAAALLVLLSGPLHPAAPPPAVWTPTAFARVPLFDEVRIDPVELQLLAWSNEPPLPRRLDQDLSSSLFIEFEPSVSLPLNLRF